jgi:hypothetical protein
MPFIEGTFNDILKIFGLFVGLLIGFRCLHVFVYPLFCYNPRKISITEIDENTNNIVIPSTTDIRNIPIAIIENGENEYNQQEQEEKDTDKLPIAIMV